MAVIQNDDLAQVLGNLRINRRREIWLWFYLDACGAHFDPNDFGAPGMRSRMATYISQQFGCKQQVIDAMSKWLLPDECLKWITSDDRQDRWLIQHFPSHATFIHFSPPPVRLLGRDLVVATIDTWDTDLAQKRHQLKELESSWNQHKEGDHIFRWFKDENESQRCSLAWEWLRKNQQPFTSGKEPVDSYKKLLSFFDQVSPSEAEKTVFIAAIKRRWTQQQYRENMTGKKQYNFLLSDKAIKHLDKLAETYDLKRTQILEVLIKMEAEKGVYIPEKLKIIQNL